jgi:hypothetical protein
VLIKNSRTAVVVILLVGLLSAVGAACLPDNPYQRFQLYGLFYRRLAWIYERIHYDPKPIDVVVVGSSKTFTGVSADEVEQRLSALGKRANVANLSLVIPGRDAQWAVLDELYKAKSPGILVVPIEEILPSTGHPWFKYFASPGDVAFPPSRVLYGYLNNISFLPFRQMELFAASVFPNLFGLGYAFDPEQYAKTRTDFTSSFMEGIGGKLMDMERQVPAAELVAEHEKFKKFMWRSKLPKAFADIVEAIIEADDRVYLDRIARIALAHGTKILLLYIPDFDSGKLAERLTKYYSNYGTILDYSDLASRSTLFMDSDHLNHAGAMIVSDRIADAIAPQL